MIMGCGGFVVAAVGIYLLGVWPFLAFQDVHRLRTLGLCAALGFFPTALVSAFASRRFGLPGACGAVGGALTVAVFLYLRVQQAFTAAVARQDTPPDYPDLFAILLPIAWVLGVTLVVSVLLPKGELPSPEE